MRKSLLAAAMAPLLCLAPGCIIQDINDGIGRANENLETINASFSRVEEANALLTRVDAQLTSVEDQLDHLNTRLQLLERVNDQLTEIDAELAASGWRRGKDFVVVS